MAPLQAWPRLEAPPVVEVMCGVFFSPVAAIDPITVGGLRQYFPGEYPRHSIQPAVMDAPVAFFGTGVGPLRSWLLSAEDDWLLQIQADRFYVNWRRRTSGYPSFSGTGATEGVLARAMREIERFRRLCRDHLRAEIATTAVEVAKVDRLTEGEHWGDIGELGRIVPLVADLTRFAKPPNLELGVNISDRDDQGAARVVTLTLSTELLEGKLARALKIETRCTKPLAGQDAETIRSTFEELNATANAAFFGLISQAELGRFQKKS